MSSLFGIFVIHVFLMFLNEVGSGDVVCSDVEVVSTFLWCFVSITGMVTKLAY